MRHSRMDVRLDRLRAHPYFAVTNEKGEFTLEDVPAGEYKLGYWHEACGTNSKAPVAVTVEAGGTITQDFTLKLK